MIKTRKRLFSFIRIFFGMALNFRKEFKLIKKKGYQEAQKIMRKRHERNARAYYKAAVEMKGALIKLGQFFSTRVDVFPEPYIRILKPLQDNIPSIDFPEIEKILAEEYGDYKSLFREIDKNPVASASIAQVHRAVLKDGKEAALKILKPEAEIVFDIDFAILYFVFDLFSHFKFFRENMQFTVLLRDFITVTGDELNFRREAFVIDKFRDYFGKNPYIKIPGVFEEYSTPKIIAMEFLDGIRLSDKEAWIRDGGDPGTIAQRLIEFYAEQIFYFEYTHYDPHPGNILVMRNNVIGILDFGMSGVITGDMKSGIRDALAALMKKDPEAMIRAFQKLGFFTENINRSSLATVIQYIFDTFYDILENIRLNREELQAGMEKMNLRPILDDLIEIVYTNSITLPASWVYLGKTLGSLSGLISSLDPEIKIFDALRPYINEFINSNYKMAVKTAINTITGNLKLLMRLPDKLNDFIKGIESGRTDIRVDTEELLSRLDEFSRHITRIVSSAFFIISGVLSYIFLRKDQADLFWLFLVLAIVFLLAGILYRKKSRKNIIRKHIEKMR